MSASLPPSRRLRDFADLPSVRGGASRAEAALGASAHADAWADITQAVDGLSRAAPRAPDASLDAAARRVGREGVVGDDGGGGGAREGEVVFDGAQGSDDDFCGAGDVSLKTKVQMVSGARLGWVLAGSQRACYGAVGALWGGEGDGGGLFERGLLHFRHPSTRLMGSVAGQWQLLFVNGGGGSVLDSLRERLEEWQGAFRSLFYGWRYGQVQGFYVVLSTTAVRFISGDGEGDGKTVVVARATPGLVGLFEDSGIPFVQRKRARRRLRGGGGDGSIGKADSILGGDDGALSDDDGAGGEREEGEEELPSLIIRGAVNAHAVFNFLLDVGPRLGNATDVPIIVCDSPFAGGQIFRASARDARETRTADGSPRYDATIYGLLTALQFSRICEAVMTEQGESGLTLYLETEEKSRGLATQGEADRVVSRVRGSAGGGVEIFVEGRRR